MLNTSEAPWKFERLCGTDLHRHRDAGVQGPAGPGHPLRHDPQNQDQPRTPLRIVAVGFAPAVAHGAGGQRLDHLLHRRLGHRPRLLRRGVIRPAERPDPDRPALAHLLAHGRLSGDRERRFPLFDGHRRRNAAAHQHCHPARHPDLGADAGYLLHQDRRQDTRRRRRFTHQRKGLTP